MELKVFENETIPKEIHRFYDDLANIYLKSSYDYGMVEKGEIKEDKIGRYKLSSFEISIIDENTKASFLLNTKEGYQKQDEIVLLYHKYILLKELSQIIDYFINETIDISNFKYRNDKSEISREGMGDKYTNTIKVSISGLLLATHMFGIRKITKLFNEHIVYVDENNIPISYYINNKDYDLSFILSEIYTLVYPKISDEELKGMEDSEEFIGQNQKDILEQLRKEIIEQEKSNKGNSKKTSFLSKILNEGVNIAKQYVAEYIKSKFIKKEEKGNQNSSGKSNGTQNFGNAMGNRVKSDKKSYLIPKNKENLEKIANKFNRDYGVSKFSEYFEDTTNREMEKENKSVFNEILKGVNDKDNAVIYQKKHKSMQKIINKELKLVDYLYEICSKSDKPLETLENSLKYLSASYEENVFSYGKTIVVDTLKSKAKSYAISKINAMANKNIVEPKKDYVEHLGLSDIDDIVFKIDKCKFEDYVHCIEFKFLELFKNHNLVRESFSRQVNRKRKYVKARRLLDNLQIELVKTMIGLTKKEFDGASRKDNIFNNYIIFLDEEVAGLSMDEYTFFNNIANDKNLLNLVIAIIKSNYTHKEKSLKKLSDLMYYKKYEKYTDMNTRQEDSVVIKQHFSTFYALEYNMKLRNAKYIATFFEILYKTKEEKEQMYYVCDGAKVSCSFSTDLTTLNVLTSDKLISGKNSANIEDTNIIPFKACSANKVCIAKLSKWQKIVNETVKGKYALMSNSTCVCEMGGILKIVSANQTKQSIKKIDKRENEIKYSIYDYKPISLDNIQKILSMFLSQDSIKAYNTADKLKILDKAIKNFLRMEFRPIYDKEHLVSDNCIVAFNTTKKILFNIYDLAEYIKVYYIKKNNMNIALRTSIEKKAEKLSKFDGLSFFMQAINELKSIKNYDIESSMKNEAFWMKKVYEEELKCRNKGELKKNVIKYHKLGANMVANINTPWCASFVNYIMNIGLKSASSQVYYKPEGLKYYNKLEKSRYGALLVLKYSEYKGHVTFIVSEDKNGYVCIGGNQGGRIKKSYFPKNDKLVGIFWPKHY